MEALAELGAEAETAIDGAARALAYRLGSGADFQRLRDDARLGCLRTDVRGRKLRAIFRVPERSTTITIGRVGWRTNTFYDDLERIDWTA